MSSLNNPAIKSYSFAGTAIAVANAIVTSIATAASPQTYTGAGLTGAMGGALTPCPRRVTATLSSHAASYVASSTITVAGTDGAGSTITDVLTIVGTGGGATITGTKFFATITSIVVQAQADALGAFTFGVSDAQVNARAVRVGTTGNLHVQYSDHASTVDTVPKVQAGEMVPGMIAIVFGDSTAQDITAYI